MVSNSHPVRLLTTPQAAALMGLRPNTLEIWRASGKGPVYRKLAGRAVRYVEAEILQWIADQTCSSTSQTTSTQQAGARAGVGA